MQDIVPLHTLHTAYDIRCGIALRMSDMKSVSARIWEHIQNIALRLIKIPCIAGKGFVVQPVALPLFFYFLMVVIHNCILLYISNKKRPYL